MRRVSQPPRCRVPSVPKLLPSAVVNLRDAAFQASQSFCIPPWHHRPPRCVLLSFTRLACQNAAMRSHADLPVSLSEFEATAARDAAALLTASAYGPINAWSVVLPSDCGLRPFARMHRFAKQSSGWSVRQPSPAKLPPHWSFRTGGQYVLQVPYASEIIDGACEHSPCPLIFANHSGPTPGRNPTLISNTGQPCGRRVLFELRGQMCRVASEPICAGREMRIDYESGSPLDPHIASITSRAPLWTHILVAWGATRDQYVPPPPPTAGCEQDAGALAPLVWEGESGGDERLEKLAPLLTQPNQQRSLSPYSPSRTNERSRAGLGVLWPHTYQAAVGAAALIGGCTFTRRL